MLYLILFLVLLPSQAFACFQLPTIILTERLMIYSFVLIVGLEAWIIHKYLPNLQKKQSFFISLKANLFTTFVTIPGVWLTWIVVLATIAKYYVLIPNRSWVLDNIVGAEWIGEDYNMLLAEWVMAPAYFFASYYIEYRRSRKKLKNYTDSEIERAFFFANLYSFLMIMLFETSYQIWLYYYKAAHPEAWYWW